MKIHVIAITILLCSCVGPEESHVTDPSSSSTVPGDIYITVVDGCEYVVWDHPAGYAGMGGITHKGNCSNTIHQTRSEQ